MNSWQKGVPPAVCVGHHFGGTPGANYSIERIELMRHNETLRPEVLFKWQASYSAFTVNRWDVRKVINYIKKQKEHHATGQVIESLEMPSASD